MSLLHVIVSQKAASRVVLPPTSHEGGFAEADAQKCPGKRESLGCGVGGGNVMSLRNSENTGSLKNSCERICGGCV